MIAADLTQLALLGTERQSLPSLTPGSPIANLLAQLDPADRESFVLSAAALACQHERAGALAGRETSPAPAACPLEILPRVNSRAGAALQSLLGGERSDLLPEWFDLAARTHQLAPPEALPALLALGESKPELRDPLLPVLGERGRWLAGQNLAWGWVAGATEDEGIWQTGEPPARLLYLQRLRKTSPQQARELLAATWKEEGPEDRAALLGALSVGLSAEDEPFLEDALDDKRKEVRRTAADFLARLPASALVGRMTERAMPFLKFSAGESGSVLRLKKAKKPALEILLPAECDKAMLRDGIEPKAQAALGEKAWWLVQILQIVPLNTWTAAWHCEPADILSASFAGEWKKELFEAWTRAAVAQRNADWAEPLLAAALEMKRVDKPSALLAVLPQQRLETRLSEMLEADDDKSRDLNGLLVLQCRHDWSPGFSRKVLAWLRSVASEPSTDWQLRNQLQSLANHLAPEMLPEAAANWPTESKGWEFWSKGVEELISAAQFRHEMREALMK
jgi:hypothetical protein